MKTQQIQHETASLSLLLRTTTFPANALSLLAHYKHVGLLPAKAGFNFLLIAVNSSKNTRMGLLPAKLMNSNKNKLNNSKNKLNSKKKKDFSVNAKHNLLIHIYYLVKDFRKK